ncbi:MAG: endonuclease/exonuclease/phosphatase family protein [Chloroflexi bacterium]|nr:endonuclease/exonuclease/phosphatase family protein [Chloroflexota bacterium]
MQSVRVLLSLASFLLRDTFHWDTVYIGLLGFAIFATAFLAAALRRLLGLRFMLIVTAGGLGVVRLAMQAWTGATVVDFVLASGGVVLFLLFLPAYLSYVRGRKDLAPGSFALGLLLGLSIDVTLLGAYTTYDVSWDGGVSTLLVVGVLAVLLWVSLWGLLSSAPASDAAADGREVREGSWSQVLPWLGLGPFLFLQMLLFQNLARLATLTEWTYPVAYAWLLFSHAVGLMVAVWTLNSGQRSRWPLAAIAGVALIAVAAVPSSEAALDAALLLVGQLSGAVLLVIVVDALVRGTGAPGLARTTASHGLGMVVLLGLVFAYYAPFDMDLPYDNPVVPPLAGLLLAICALASLRTSPRDGPAVQVGWLPAQIALLLVVVPLVWALTWETPEAEADEGFPVRIVNYNLHNGFDVDGHLGMEAIARVIEAQDPDVVGLQEVSRGWVVNGSLDMLTWLSQRLEMPYIFGPATGSLWGNAMLSRYPILEWESVKLPPEGLLFSRGYLWARLDLGDGQQLRVVTTHLHHIREDAAVRAQQAQELLDFWGGDDRTVIMGDFNARKDDPEAQMIRDAGLADVLDLAGIDPGYTVPSEAPKYRIDYIWLSPDLTAEEVVIPTSEASDHMPVVATVLLR